MKKLMLGNAAVARGLYEAGCRFVSSYPGTPSTEITEEAVGYDGIYAEWAPNEKVAMEAAIGASIAGARSFCAMKHVGMNVAADPMFTASYTGVNAGMLIAVADDPGMHSSQNEQDSRHYAIAAKLPMLEPSDSSECLAFVKEGYAISEQFDAPVILRTCTRVAHSQSAVVELGERADIPLKDYVKNAPKFVAAPANAVKRHVVVEERMRALAQFAETTSLNREEMGDTEVGFVTSGTCYLYVREVFPNASVFKLGLVNPLPVDSLRAFAGKVKKLIVVEELDGVIEAHLRAHGIRVDGGKDLFGLLGELSQGKLRAAMGVPQPESAPYDEMVPARPPVMCPGCPHRGLFAVLSKLKLTVMGDIGCYTLGASAPLAAMDTTVCMGASIGMAHGFTKMRPDAAKRTVAIIGDSTFMHSGMTGVVNVAYNKGVSTVIVLDNAITGMTGHQQNPTTGLTLRQEPTVAIRIEDVCRAAGIERVRVVDPQDMRAVEAALREELAVDAPSVIIARRPCMLLKYVKPNPPLAVDAAKCVGCKSCLRIGCPAISFRDGKASVDETICVGCGLCEQMCKFGAFQKKEA